MSRLRIRHESLYTYPRPVQFGVWRLLMRPLDTHAIRIIDASLETPPARVAWTYDAYGNCVCHLQPTGPADHLKVVNNLLVERFPAPIYGVGVSAPPSTLPIAYGAFDRRVLAPFIEPDTVDDDALYGDWLHAMAPRRDEPALAFLTRLNAAIHDQFRYAIRNEAGTQGPSETLSRNSGTCRDFAWLMIETVRRFGFAARFATGYLFCPGATVRGAGATHAWCEVFLPGEGWVEFDPTNALVESACLIRVATTRTWQESDPMNGFIFGDAPCHLSVSVDVDLVDDQATRQAMAA
jgi:transglutaminase-like putative cysteine protease